MPVNCVRFPFSNDELKKKRRSAFHFSFKSFWSDILSPGFEVEAQKHDDLHRKQSREAIYVNNNALTFIGYILTNASIIKYEKWNI